MITYLDGLTDAIRRLEELRKDVSGAYEIGVLMSISTLEKYADFVRRACALHEDGE